MALEKRSEDHQSHLNKSSWDQSEQVAQATLSSVELKHRDTEHGEYIHLHHLSATRQECDVQLGKNVHKYSFSDIKMFLILGRNTEYMQQRVRGSSQTV